jgi:soluble lytic murein transglycosylase
MILASFALILLTHGTQSHAGIYRYVDENGVIHFTNVPTSPHYVLYLQEDGDIHFEYGGEDQFDHLIEDAARAYSVDFALIKAMIRAESDFDPRAVSRVGAMGLMQLMPETADRLSVIDAFDPRENIEAGVRHFRDLMDAFGNDLKLSLAAYNAGRNAVMQFGSIPPYRETRGYVKKVLSFYRTYRQ